MQSLIFTTPGHLDLNMVRLMGVSVKESSSPIGFFGTGLKYAIAVALRLNGQVIIYMDGQKHTFGGESITLRGQSFTQVLLDGERLGFTTELGKTWTPWMVVRELYSNTLDEGGFCESGEFGEDYLISDCEHQTHIQLVGPEFLEVWRQRHQYFLDLEAEAPLHESYAVDAYPRLDSKSSVFYKGIKVYESPEPMHFRYNLKEKIDLSEDRGLKYPFQLREAVEKFIVTCEDPSVVHNLLTPPQNSFEATITFVNDELMHLEPSLIFQETCAQLAAKKPSNLNQKAIRYYQRRLGVAEKPPAPVELTPLQGKQLAKALDFLKQLDFCSTIDDYPIITVDWLAEHCYGQAKHGKIYLTKQAYDLGTKKLAAIILEEFVHNHYSLYDETREMQSWLFERIITLGEQHVTQEPL